MSVIRKTRGALTAVAVAAGVLAGCSGAGPAPASPTGSAPGTTGFASAKIEVVCATFPAYDWVMQVVGDNVEDFEVTYLMGSGVDLHSYQPTVEDVARIADADLFVYVGGESDEWAADAVEAAANPDLHTVNMLEVMGDAAVEEEVVEGMEADEHDHDADDVDGPAAADNPDPAADAAADADADEGPEYDEHVWLSLKNARVLVDAIAAELADIDPARAEAYAANASAYNAELADLDARYAQTVEAAPHDTLVFGDRFPFRYLVDDYGLGYYAAFVGCSAETEASFETIAFLAQKVDELGISRLLVIENSDRRIAETVIQNTQAQDQQILVLDSLQSATDADVAAGKTYLSAMEDNLSVLAEALG